MTIKKEKNLLKKLSSPIFSKVFEKIIDNYMFNHFIGNKLFTLSQSSFSPGDLFIADHYS